MIQQSPNPNPNPKPEPVPQSQSSQPSSNPTPTEPLYPTHTYTNPRHIRYLQDFLTQTPKPLINYKRLDLQAMDENSVQINQYDNIYQKLYKKFARDGYLQKTTQITKKSKKGGDQNYYNSSDPFIDDGFTVEQKDSNRQCTYSDFKAVQCSLADFYRSQDYRPPVEVAAEPRRKGERMEIPEEEKEKIFRKVKNKREEDARRNQG